MTDTEGFFDRLRRALGREKKELDEMVEDAARRGNEALDRKEHELRATPEERLRLEQEKAQQAEDEYEALRRRIEGGG